MTHIAFRVRKSTVSISPVSDIVMDVARAADPVKSRVAAEKLSRGETSNQTSNGDFGHVLTNTLTNTSATWQSSRINFGGGGTKSSQILPHMDAQTKAYKSLGQLVLKNLVESMLPKESGAFFGTGTAGEIWRSFLADQLATQAGKTIDLGIVHKPTAAPNSLTSRGPGHIVQTSTPYGSLLHEWS
jgi:peptidoglycan hydrolase FlgJ